MSAERELVACVTSPTQAAIHVQAEVQAIVDQRYVFVDQPYSFSVSCVSAEAIRLMR